MNKLVYLLLLRTILAFPPLKIRDPCGPGKKGTCVLVDHCHSLHELIRKREHHDKLEVCGWQGKTQIVCCNDLKETRAPFQERKSIEECIKYGEEGVNVGALIVNGKNAKIGEYPHMAAIGYEVDDVSSKYTWNCAGSLISENYVLTAGHCLDTTKLPVIIRLGKVDLYGNEDNATAQDIPVGKLIQHPDFHRLKRVNDIGLIRLAKPAVFTKYVQPACLQTSNDTPVDLYVSGWGAKKRFGEPSRFLQQARVSHVNLSRCNEIFLNSPLKRAIPSTQLCALGNEENVTDTCQGDSGAPIQSANRRDYGTTFTVIGVTSFGSGCAAITPGIYTKVYDYLDWIEKIVWS